MPAGRPTKYRPEFVEIAADMCRKGATDPEVAAAFGVKVSTLYRWKLVHEAFCDALQTGKEPADERVARSLYQRATGYTQKVDRVFCTKGGTIVRAKVTERVPPDVAAAFIWLKNRRPNDWRDRKDVALSGAVEVTRVERVIVDPEKK